MRRSVLVFALLVLSTTSARAGVECVCATDVEILPARGARDVPGNTKVWVVGGMLGRSRLDGGSGSWVGNGKLVRADDARAIQRFDVGSLAAGRSYVFRGLEYGPRTRFTTGASEDTAPPARPAVRALWIAVSERGAGTEPVAELGFDAALDPDVALLHFVFTSGRTRLSRVTTTSGWRDLGQPMCGTALPFLPGEAVSIAVSAIDLAGNESEAFTREVVVGRAASRLPSCARVPVGCGMSISLFFWLVPMGSAAGLIGLLVVYFRRVRDARLAVPEPISLLVVERLARAVQRRAGVIATVGVVGVPALVIMDVGPLAIISTVVGCIGLRGYFIARAVLHLVEGAVREPATAELVGNMVIVRSATDETRLEVSTSAVAAARQHAVPASIAHRPHRQ